ncbi:MAG: Undecaprenyl-diphosphatase [Candidatus Saccharibacteria bacterium GW2011_GWC2_48_9]|nr:MAG: Undecaprenyl-diphosphatase [Candidatus Saccharibacteria bacterium GW2011_GWC2_48_9]
MEWWHAVLLGVIEGVTEFLPVSSTGHLTIAEKLLGYQIDDPSVTAFTAIIQVGAVLATVIYLRRDIWRVVQVWLGCADRLDTNWRHRTSF